MKWQYQCPTDPTGYHELADAVRVVCDAKRERSMSSRGRVGADDDVEAFISRNLLELQSQTWNVVTIDKNPALHINHAPAILRGWPLLLTTIKKVEGKFKNWRISRVTHPQNESLLEERAPLPLARVKEPEAQRSPGPRPPAARRADWRATLAAATRLFARIQGPSRDYRAPKPAPSSDTKNLFSARQFKRRKLCPIGNFGLFSSHRVNEVVKREKLQCNDLSSRL